MKKSAVLLTIRKVKTEISLRILKKYENLRVCMLVKLYCNRVMESKIQY